MTGLVEGIQKDEKSRFVFPKKILAYYGLGLGVVGEIRERQPNLALKIN